ncbi:MAG: peptidyl-prolyl cis-trans isomerase [Myxococcales bacterium]|nr:peptidyl-prolyl cis-trans isomerase [Myxococcales bacterium]
MRARLFRLASAGIALCLALALGAKAASAAPEVTLVTNKGNIVITLNQRKAPKSVANFLKYVRSGHYNGTVFHRVIPNFMVQGGGFTAQYRKKPTRAPIHNEADNGLRNVKGSLAMARTSDPHSASAQFFINVADNGFLDHKSKTRRGWGYAVFGKVKRGMNVVMAIVNSRTGAAGPFQKNVPLDTVVIRKAYVGKGGSMLRKYRKKGN